MTTMPEPTSEHRLVQEHLDKAVQLQRNNKHRQARLSFIKAAALLEKIAPASAELADTYLKIAFSFWSNRYRTKHSAERRREGLTWYEKALSTWAEIHLYHKLSRHLSNISSMYFILDDRHTALERAERALKIEREHPTPADSPTYNERIAAWTKVAGCYIAIHQLAEANEVIDDGLAIFGEESQQAGYLWALKSQYYEELAKACRDKAEAILPPQSCMLRTKASS